jgi:DMSO/TMAO reductase YedYZ molybdopterin-dependent catalytic subunit
MRRTRREQKEACPLRTASERHSEPKSQPTALGFFRGVESVSRRAFLRSLSGSAAWALTAPALARAPLIEHGSPGYLETPLHQLGKSWITPNRSFFVLSRALPSPLSNPENWTITLWSVGGRKHTLRLADLRDRARFGWQEFPACIQCAGYGRRFFRPPIEEIPWGHGAVGNAIWGGVRLADVLQATGLVEDARHLAFVGVDSSPRQRDDFIRSIPVAKAMDRHTILALTMNGEPLPLAHGAPVRMIVPGWIGAYQMKWLTHIIARRERWDGHWMNKAYTVPRRPMAPGDELSDTDWKPLTALPVNSVITAPLAGARARHGAVEVRGFAWSGGGEIKANEVSIDLGETWQSAELSGPRGHYAWRHWACAVQAKRGTHTIMARATDRSGAMQPLRQNNWNPGGYGWHTAHSVSIDVV